MCGIVGYIGKQNALPTLIEGLKKLEYRGYDSAGCSIINGARRVKTIKKIGRVKELEKELSAKNPEGNLGIAHCLTPDTYIQLLNGQIVQLSKISGGEEVLSLNIGTKKLEPAKVVKLFQHKSPKFLYYLRTHFSYLKCTAEHRMFVFSEEKIIEKRAKDINKKDLLIIPQEVNIQGKKIKFKPIFVKRYYRILGSANKLINFRLEEKLLTKSAISFQAGVSKSYLDHIINNDRNFREDELRKLLPFLSIQFPSDCFKPVNTIHGKFINLPKESSPELMQFLGYFIGDGTAQPKTIRFKDTNKEVLEIYKKLINELFNIKGRIVPQKDTIAFLLEVNSTYLSKWLKENIVLRKKEFLREIGQLPKEEIAAFLRGIFDAEGCVAVKSEQIKLGITDKEIGRILPQLFLRIGIVPSFRQIKRKNPAWNNVYLISLNNNFSFRKFSRFVGFSSYKKARKLKLLVQKKPKRSFKKNISDSSIAFQQILEIKKIKSKEEVLYDLEVTPRSNFFANGFLAHNSRWATHGSPSTKNAHPHSDCKQNIWVVHNGIIENYKALKQKLLERGHRFHSETDSEIIPHLIEEYFTGNLEKAVTKALRKIKGAYALAIISRDDSQKIVAARNSSPLVIGVGDKEYIIASDASPILPYTNKVVYLDDREVATITKDSLNLTNLNHENLERLPEELDWSVEDAQKGGFPHFTLKEIYEIPEVIENSLRGRIITKEGLARLGGLNGFEDRLRKISKIIIVAMGTAYNAGLAGEYMLEEYAGITTEVENAAEFRYRKPIIDKNTAVLAISQSGETADTLAAIREAKQKGALILGIVNTVGSSVARTIDAGIYNHAGPEIGVASTKVFNSQIAVLALLALFLGRQRQMSQVMGKRIAEELLRIPQKIRWILKQDQKIKELAKKYKTYNNFLYLGRKYNYPIALEGALKLKELSYVHAEGYGAAEMKHGPIALIDENFPSLFIAPSDSVYEKVISNMEEIRARRGLIIALATQGNRKIGQVADEVMYIPKTLEMLTPLLSVLPLQLFAYHIAALRGCDVDKPRNLAKSVTVE